MSEDGVREALRSLARRTAQSTAGCEHIDPVCRDLLAEGIADVFADTNVGDMVRIAMRHQRRTVPSELPGTGAAQ